MIGALSKLFRKLLIQKLAFLATQAVSSRDTNPLLILVVNPLRGRLNFILWRDRVDVPSECTIVETTE
jgi:hypothetical protein